ncbi:cytochrome-c oxidase, cbb3-type subunit III [Neisseria sp. Ec49-e6-T10]|uniref:cytochrome-c oxidase, cbb3-type subunit III n=1 Tax=Neisseria sp. Ec49-e6-T10 TaxID=3140744 RepID=UPI003EBF5B6E
MNTTTDFTSNFWNIYICVIVIVSIIAVFWLLLSQSKSTVKKGEEVKTVGHVWDEDLEEYNNPLPRWWMIMFLLTLVFSVGYLIVYPGMGDYKGYFKWTSHNQYEGEVAEANKAYKSQYDKYLQTDVKMLATDPQAMKTAQNLYNTYCMQCHGADARGSRGFPNLTDSDWLWGGEPEQIHESIRDGRMGIMAAWGEQLTSDQIEDAANYVLSLSGKPHNTTSAMRGNDVFHNPPANCATCHGADGKGILTQGPNLTDNIWLWGSSKKAIIDTITNGHENEMPAWGEFLDESKVHLLTAYVWGLSNNTKKEATK